MQKPGSPQEALNELTHYGVLGMKWGVRKDGKPQGFGNRGSTKLSRNLKSTARVTTRATGITASRFAGALAVQQILKKTNIGGASAETLMRIGADYASIGAVAGATKLGATKRTRAAKNVDLKKDFKNLNPAYNKKAIQNDIKDYGLRGSRQINDALNRGEKLQQARTSQAQRKMLEFLAIGATTYGQLKLIEKYGEVGYSSLMGKVASKVSDRKSNNARAATRGLAARNFAKEKRGVYNVTTLKR